MALNNPAFNADEVYDSESLKPIMHLISGSTPQRCSTPQSCFNFLAACLDEMNPADVPNFCSLVCLCATTQRNVVSEFLAQNANVELSIFCRRHFWLNNQLNITKLNMIGHLVIHAAGGNTQNPIIQNFRDRIKAQSIWVADLEKANLSETQKKIFAEKRSRISFEDVETFATPVSRLIGERFRGQSVQVIINEIAAGSRSQPLFPSPAQGGCSSEEKFDTRLF